MFSTRASNHVIAGPSYEHANAAARGGAKICRPDTRRVVPRRVTRNLAILGSHASSRNNYAKYGRPETNRGNERSQESWKPTISRSASLLDRSVFSNELEKCARRIMYRGISFAWLVGETRVSFYVYLSLA